MRDNRSRIWSKNAKMAFLTPISPEAEGYRHPVTSVRWSSTSCLTMRNIILVPIPVVPAVTVKNAGLETLTLHICRTDGPRSQRFEPYIVPIDPYEHAEFGCSAFRGYGDIRRRFRNRLHLQTGSLMYFRSVPEVDLDDLQVCLKSQVAGSYRFRVIVVFFVSFPPLPALSSDSTIAELSCASRMRTHNMFSERVC